MHSTRQTEPKAPLPSSWTCLNRSQFVSTILFFSDDSSSIFSLIIVYFVLNLPFCSSFFLPLTVSLSESLFLTKCKLPVLFRYLLKLFGFSWSATLVIDSSGSSSLDCCISWSLPSDLSVGFRLIPRITGNDPFGYKLCLADPSFEPGLDDNFGLAPGIALLFFLNAPNYPFSVPAFCI